MSDLFSKYGFNPDAPAGQAPAAPKDDLFSRYGYGDSEPEPEPRRREQPSVFKRALDWYTRQVTDSARAGARGALDTYSGLADIYGGGMGELTGAMGGDPRDLAPGQPSERADVTQILGPDAVETLRGAQATPGGAFADLAASPELQYSTPAGESAVDDFLRGTSYVAGGGVSMGAPASLAANTINALSALAGGVGYTLALGDDASLKDAETARDASALAGAVGPAVTLPGAMRAVGAVQRANARRLDSAAPTASLDPTMPSAAIRKEAIETLYSLAEREGMSPDQFVAKVAERAQAGDKGSLALLTDSGLLKQAESYIARVAPVSERELFRGEQRRVQQEATQQSFDEMEGIAREGAPTEALQAQRNLVRSAKAQRERVKREAMADADVARSEQELRLADTDDPLTTNRRVAEALKGAQKQQRAAVDALWDKVPSTETMNVGNVKARVNAVLQRAAQDGTTKVAEFRKDFADELAYFTDAAPDKVDSITQVNFKKRQLRDRIQQAVREGRGAGNENDRLLTLLTQAIDDEIAKVPGSQALRDATAAERQFRSVYRDGPLGQALKRSRNTPELLADFFIRPNTKGVEVRNALAADEDGTLQRAMEDAVRSRFSRQQTPRQRRSWLDKHSALLDGMEGPDGPLRQSLRASIEGDELVDRLQKRAEGFKGADQPGIDRSAVARASAGRDLTDRAAVQNFGNIVKPSSASRLGDVRRLVASARRTNTLPGLQATAREHVMDKISRAGLGNDVDQISAGAVDFFEKNRDWMEAVFTPEQLRQFDDAMKRINDAQAAPGYDMTLKGLEASKSTESISANIRRMVVRIGLIAGVPTGSHQLIMANLLSKGTDRFMRRIPNEQYRRAIMEYLLTPQAFLDDIEQLNVRGLGAEETGRRVAEMISRRGQALRSGRLPAASAAAARLGAEERNDNAQR